MNGPAVQAEISAMRGEDALPRSNGELVFAAPWEGRAMAMAIAAVQSLELPWDEFRSRLVAEIARAPERPYYESWLCALERLLCERGVLTAEQLRSPAPAEMR
jgi:nitrile hydratase accessory protein